MRYQVLILGLMVLPCRGGGDKDAAISASLNVKIQKSKALELAQQSVGAVYVLAFAVLQDLRDCMKPKND